MLDILRKHASSWVIKAMLAAIVITFIFFFGWSAMRRSTRGAAGQENSVGSVNGRPIPLSEFRFLLDQTYERLRQGFEGEEVPEFLRKMALQTTLQQMAARQLSLALSEGLGASVPDQVLADAVRNMPDTQRDGVFDPVLYRDHYLPYFKQRYGLDIEKFISEQIKIDEAAALFEGIRILPAPMEEKAAEWTFEVVELDPEKLKESHGSAEDVKELAKDLISSGPGKWRGLLKGTKAETKKVGPIGLARRDTLLDGNGTFEDHQAIFSLSPESPVIPSPIERGGRIYVVRLLAMLPSEDAAAEPPLESQYFNAWMSKLMAKARVESFLDKEQ